MTAVPTDFLARIDVIIAKSHCLDLATLNEANTKALLIEPVLSALGWDVLDLDSVTREYKVYDGTFLDYALLVGAKALLFCEAKPTGKHLDDSKWVSQTINYANNEGVVWCVLTDGLHWRVFKANEAVSMHKKLAFELNIEDLIDPVRRPEALRLFACLTPAAVAEGDLSTLGTQIFVDGQVREALGSLVEEPSKRFLDAPLDKLGARWLTANVPTPPYSQWYEETHRRQVHEQQRSWPRLSKAPPRSSKVPTAHHQPSGTEFAEVPRCFARRHRNRR